MKILIIGRGGREHALALACIKSANVSEVFVAPGNAGTASIATNIDIDELDNDALVAFAIEEEINLTVVGPEAALSNGIVNKFQDNNLKIFGPTKEATMIESSKEYAKGLMIKHNIPTGKYKVFSEYKQALHYVKGQALPIVIKYDGLAAGKGVVIAESFEEAESTLNNMLNDKSFGNASVVIEEYLEGPEFSLMAFCNGTTITPMVISQDHKRAYDGDEGPNTGGMGIYSPVPIISNNSIQYAVNEIMEVIAKGLYEDKKSFTGFLYGGLMLTSTGVQVIEFNARFGDPEAEILLSRLESDFVQVLLDVMDNKKIPLKWNSKSVVGVCMAANGYPSTYKKNHIIKGLEKLEYNVFHMGTTIKEGNIVSNGGRVLLVTGEGKTLKEAQDNAYENVNKIDCDSLFYRKDIGHKAIN